MKTSLFSLNIKDFLKGLFVSVLTALLTGLTVFLEQGSLPTSIELKQIALASAIAGLAYIAKNFLTNSKDQILTKEPDKLNEPGNPKL